MQRHHHGAPYHWSAMSFPNGSPEPRRILTSVDGCLLGTLLTSMISEDSYVDQSCEGNCNARRLILRVGASHCHTECTGRKFAT